MQIAYLCTSTYEGGKKNKRSGETENSLENSSLQVWCDNSIACSVGCVDFSDVYRVERASFFSISVFL